MSTTNTTLMRRAEAGETVAYHAEKLLAELEKFFPEVAHDLDETCDAVLKAISEMRLL